MDSTRPIRALTRGLEALTVLNLRNGATVSEVAQEIKLPRTTVYRILETLCESGFAFRDGADDRYRLAEAVKHLSDGFVDEDWITHVASPLIHELTRELVWPIALATLSGTSMLIRETTDHLSPLAVERYSAGFRFPLLTSASGRLYLALCEPAERASLIEALAKSGKPEAKLARSPADLDRMLIEVRTLGYATAATARRISDDFTIAVPIQWDNRILAGLSIRVSGAAMPAKTATERYLPRLRECAVKISARLTDKRPAPVRGPDALV